MRHYRTARRPPATAAAGFVLMLGAGHLSGALAETPAEMPGSATGTSSGSARGVASSGTEDCSPDVIALPPVHPGEDSAATGVNADGWSTGWVKDGRNPRRAVLWTHRDGKPSSPVELGIGGRRFPSGRTVEAVPVDVNVDGVIAIQVPGHRTRDAGDIWDTSSRPLLRLPGTRARPEVVVRALDAQGRSAGSIAGPGSPSRAAVWLHGELTVLPHPRGWAASYAADTAHGGWVVGSVSDCAFLNPRSRPWWWRIGGPEDGRNGPLDTRHGGRSHLGSADSSTTPAASSATSATSARSSRGTTTRRDRSGTFPAPACPAPSICTTPDTPSEFATGR